MILVIFVLVFAVMTYGVIPFADMGLPLPSLGWWFPELSALFVVGGVVIGALLLGVINMGMSIMGIGDSWQYVVKGGVLLVAVIFDVVTSRKSGK